MINFPIPLAVYYEREFNPLINKVLSDYFQEFDRLFNLRGYRLVYFPSAGMLNPLPGEHFSYYQPEYRLELVSGLSQARRTLSAPYFVQLIYQAIRKLMGEISFPEAGFILSDGSRQFISIDFSEASAGLKGKPGAEKLLREKILQQISDLRPAGIPRNRIMTEMNYYHVREPVEGFTRLRATDPESLFSEESRMASLEVEEDLEKRLKEQERFTLLDLLLQLMEEVKQLDPAMSLRLQEMMHFRLKTGLEKLSPMRLMLTHGGFDYKILLPAYDLEIDMPQLPKALYLFFLRHPEGIFLHDLPDHREELRSIYARIASLSDPDTVRANADRLTDLADNSVHVNCARIKKAFLSRITDRLARYYYVRGQRGKVKKIFLPARLLSIDPELLSF